ncbi:MAG: desulfoferrodoxin family protein [Eubacteriales bacterium]|jgi:superoxide reductase
MKFYVCSHCGNMIVFMKSAGVPVMCCGQKMDEVIPGTVDAAVEKHVPVVSVNGRDVLVKVGAVEHPMQEEHYIEWIVVETKNGFQKKSLKPGEKPEASFALAEGDAVEAVYAYCNLHGLWKA